mmetsp:Transcript_39517/g.86204  ORF Transcript_39517/g.86204 Transcript_39517/m.86204 type:complete len:112 (+) Transcript_39517:407-742(+)
MHSRTEGVEKPSEELLARPEARRSMGARSSGSTTRLKREVKRSAAMTPGGKHRHSTFTWEELTTNRQATRRRAQILNPGSCTAAFSSAKHTNRQVSFETEEADGGGCMEDA